MSQKIGKKGVKTVSKTKDQKAKAEAPKVLKFYEKKEVPPLPPPGKMKICIVGTGAIGGLVAGYLKSKVRNVTAIATNEQLRAIRQDGIHISGVKGDIWLDLDIRSQLEMKFDLVILAVKTQDIQKVVDENRQYLENTLIMTTQNGVQADKILSKSFDQGNIISSIVMFGSTYLKPGYITHNFDGKWIIGKPFTKNDEKLEQIKYELSPAFEVVIVDNIMGMKWTKLFLNLNNCIPALLGLSMQETFSNLEMTKLSIILLKEAFKVVDNEKIKLENLPDFDIAKYRGLVAMPLEEAAKVFSQIMVGLSKEPLYGSILQSIKRNRPSEIDYINGEIARLGQMGLEGAVLNTRMTHLVHQVEKTKKFFTIEELKKMFQYALNPMKL